MTRGIFVTGTDTGVGKTAVATALLRALVREGRRAIGMKPVATGLAPREPMHADVAALSAAANVAADPADLNPYAFSPPVAPHLAAAKAGSVVELDRIADAYARLAAMADAVVVEGAGGVFVPLGPRIDMLDIPRRLGVPVVLVVGLRLGCLSHALLSAHALAARGLRFAGWVANRIDPAMEEADANVAALAERLPAPLVADLAFGEHRTGEVLFDRAALAVLGLVR
jgi:dethiobiotin synthetase